MCFGVMDTVCLIPKPSTQTPPGTLGRSSLNTRRWGTPFTDPRGSNLRQFGQFGPAKTSCAAVQAARGRNTRVVPFLWKRSREGPSGFAILQFRGTQNRARERELLW